MEDNAILEMFCKRDETALVQVRTLYGARLYRTAHNILNSKEDAEECVNDTLLKAWGAIPPAAPEKLGAYLAKIVRNLALHRWEARKATKRGGGTTNLLLDELAEVLPARSGSPEKELEARAITQAISGCLKNMKPISKDVFVARYFHGETIESICKYFQISQSKAKSILHRARKKLAEHLKEEGINI